MTAQVATKLKVWKPTQVECNLIRAAAKVECYGKAVKLEPGRRYSQVDGSLSESMNVLLVDNSADWAESDLASTVDWQEFRKGVELTVDGRAAVDFYCYDREGLVSNIVVYFDNGVIHSKGASLRSPMRLLQA